MIGIAAFKEGTICNQKPNVLQELNRELAGRSVFGIPDRNILFFVICN